MCVCVCVCVCVRACVRVCVCVCVCLIQGRIISQTPKMVRDAALLNTQHSMVKIESKVKQLRVRSNCLPYT